LMISVIAARPDKSPSKISHLDLGVTLLLGFAPATLLGIPGLSGLAGAILVSIGFVAYLRLSRAARSEEYLERAQQLTEISFYLGGLATWSYV
jgi:hypothetical protein